ncbi:hypothetical protein DA075_16530 [Methylobacterium currus]|uniref:Uncharacterized protein n=1 Tax=Methylobacterium currus TaxID=2051553 RepID=A0A2R4WLB0_9HYPH|nr:hypothetical protein [Methylobacterium currus]AWB22328.1 hypothetical protein DA075_16530 [Methylobacterium currus]
MAGDVNLPEVLLPPLPRDGMAAMAAPLPVLHEYGPAVRIGLWEGALPHAPINEADLSEQERLGLQAFRTRLHDSYRDEKENRPRRSAPWDEDGGRSGLDEDQPAATPPAPPLPADPTTVPQAPQVRRLAGRIAVGVVIVSGPGPLTMTSAQQSKIITDVQNGLSFLGGRAPARDVTFTYDLHVAQIATPDTTGPIPAGQDPYEHFEAPWRDAALASIGQPAGWSGVKNYIGGIKAAKGAQAAYCAFFTHYQLHHFAYCRDDCVVMQYANDGWGTKNLDSVFAHETAHVFGAPDEYALSGCNCGGSHGAYGRPNLNCENCADGGGVACIMRNNILDMCAVTPYHLGYTMPKAAGSV